jgi:hypothetical protein
VGVGNPAEETCCRPNTLMLLFRDSLSISYPSESQESQSPFSNRHFRISWLYAIRFSLKVRL